jgi:predicted secreted protein
MSWIVYVATFFISWWFFLFLVLPFGLRTQDEEEDVTLGTVASAPRGPHMLRAVLWTTLITLVFTAAMYGLFEVYGFAFDDLPRIVPN